MENNQKSAGQNNPITVETSYAASSEQVWNAITNNDQMKLWYFELEDFKPVKGFKFSFEGGTEENLYLHLCEVTEVIPFKKLTYSWSYDNYEGISYVSFEIFPDGNLTGLKLTHAGLNTFPKSNPDFAAQNFETGWKDILGTSLKYFLEPAHSAV